MRLLLAEDEKELSNALKAILEHNKFSVDAVYNGQDALDYGLAQQYDGIILDIMMPGKDGISALKEMRDAGVTTPVLLLTAKSQVSDRISGLDCGADDYLAKPFVMGELMARVRAMTRRLAEYFPPELAVGNITLNRSTYELCSEITSVRLSNKEFQMMEMLMRAGQRMIPTEQFMEKVWGYDSETETGIVWVYISYLRRKLEALGASIEIVTLRGRGYTLEQRHDS